jgi:hypothetical protein
VLFIFLCLLAGRPAGRPDFPASRPAAAVKARIFPTLRENELARINEYTRPRRESRSADEIYQAQLALSGVALADAVSLRDALLDDALQAELRDALSALGICNRDSQINGDHPARSQMRKVRAADQCEPSGRLS